MNDGQAIRSDNGAYGLTKTTNDNGDDDADDDDVDNDDDNDRKPNTKNKESRPKSKKKTFVASYTLGRSDKRARRQTKEKK